MFGKKRRQDAKSSVDKIVVHYDSDTPPNDGNANNPAEASRLENELNDRDNKGFFTRIYQSKRVVAYSVIGLAVASLIGMSTLIYFKAAKNNEYNKKYHPKPNASEKESANRIDKEVDYSRDKSPKKNKHKKTNDKKNEKVNDDKARFIVNCPDGSQMIFFTPYDPKSKTFCNGKPSQITILPSNSSDDSGIEQKLGADGTDNSQTANQNGTYANRLDVTGNNANNSNPSIEVGAPYIKGNIVHQMYNGQDTMIRPDYELREQTERTIRSEISPDGSLIAILTSSGMSKTRVYMARIDKDSDGRVTGFSDLTSITDDKDLAQSYVSERGGILDTTNVMITDIKWPVSGGQLDVDYSLKQTQNFETNKKYLTDHFEIN
ncbi:MAG: hypothetical protein Q8O89_03380 [Nanoarchaeota archaeon]|nr:hypothetical protein [Nanoarchaeota archaeon]